MSEASADRDARITALVRGAVDMHVHSGPTLMARKIDHIEAVQDAARAGMAAIVIKDHYYPTMPFATVLNRHYGHLGVHVMGAITLNCPLGGYNVHAVDYALKQGAKVIWMPTAHAKNHLDHYKADASFTSKFPQNTAQLLEPTPLTLVDETGRVRDEVKAILDLVAAADAVVSGGHHHIDELWPFYEEAKARGVKRPMLNHPTYVNEGSLDDVRRLVAMGIMIEHSICMFVPSSFQMFDAKHLKDVIDAGGVDSTFFGSDLGQTGNPSPVEGFHQIIAMLLDLGYGDNDIRKMVAGNASRLLGLDNAQAAPAHAA
jgi:hypothetical protein